MRRVLFGSLFGIGLALVVALVVEAIRGPRDPARAVNVPPGDHEIAWFHTATNSSTWERFVAGAHRAALQSPEWHVDSSRAFLDRTTAVPEVVLSRDDSPGRLRIRWYKQSSQHTVTDWVRALAERDPPPLAVLGGGSSDRAMELANALAARDSWRGVRPLLLITTATANAVIDDQNQSHDLMSLYAERSFRFCFTNEQMARAVLDFVWRTPDLRPGRTAPAEAVAGACAVGDPWAGLAFLSAPDDTPPLITALEWEDDPYSTDLGWQFRQVLDEEIDGQPMWARLSVHRPIVQNQSIGSSVGGFLRPNRDEANVVERLLTGFPEMPGTRPLPRQPGERSLLILPTVVPAARRVLAALTGADPNLGRHLVAVGGDSIAFNSVYRDAELVWNVRLVPVPLVLFAHQNPVAWDAETVSNGFELLPPNGTDDVLHFADVVRILAAAADGATDADVLAQRLRERMPRFFDTTGNRLGGTGEYVMCLRPVTDSVVRPGATLEVWSHGRDGSWKMIQRLFVHYQR